VTIYNSTIADNYVYAGYGGGGGYAGGFGYAASYEALPGAGGRGGYSGSGYYEAPDGAYGNYGTLGNDGAYGASGSSGGGAAFTEGGGMFVVDGNITLYNTTVAYNSSGVVQDGGNANLYNSLFADNGYSGSGAGPTGADYAYSGSGAAVAYNSLFQSSPVGLTGGGSILVTNAGLSGGLAYNGGPTETIALLPGSAAIGAGQNPINGVTLFTDQRGFIPTAGWTIGAYQPGNPAAAVSGVLSATNVTPAQYGQTSYSFSITYTSAAGITPSSVADGVVTVTTPGGSILTATAGTPVANGPTDPWGDAQSFTVTYTITPPGGSWTAADNGTYTVELGGTTPIDATDGSTIPVGTVFGTFTVQTAQFSITKYSLLLNRKTHFYAGTISLTNTSNATISGPIFVLFDLPAGTILENATGTYDGEPYLEINLPPSGLAVGASVSATVEFNVNVSPSAYSTTYFIGCLSC
jgi:hypothetical protein